MTNSMVQKTKNPTIPKIIVSLFLKIKPKFVVHCTYAKVNGKT